MNVCKVCNRLLSQKHAKDNWPNYIPNQIADYSSSL